MIIEEYILFVSSLRYDKTILTLKKKRNRKRKEDSP